MSQPSPQEQIAALLSELIQAREKGEHTLEVYQVLSKLGVAYYQSQQWQEAIASFTSALDIAQTLKESNLENLTLAWLGCSYWQSGDLEQGLQYLEQRLALAQQLEDKAAQQETLPWLIQICQQQNHPDKVIQYYQLQAHLWQQQGNTVNHYTSLYELATYLFNRQQYSEALSGFQVALEVAETLSDEQEKASKIANAHYMLGQCYENLGNLPLAKESNLKAKSLYQSMGDNEREQICQD